MLSFYGAGLVKKILLIDEDRYLLALTRVSLELDGFKVLTANSKEQALQLWEDEKPDMIILDSNINGEGGITFTRQIRECQSSCQPVIVLSSKYLNEDDIQRYRQAGVDWHLAKPFNTITLGKELEHFFQRKRDA
jgi:DNA-binding response OmpR family regulator